MVLANTDKNGAFDGAFAFLQGFLDDLYRQPVVHEPGGEGWRCLRLIAEALAAQQCSLGTAAAVLRRYGSTLPPEKLLRRACQDLNMSVPER
ncbi:MAG: hypothetical protein H0Z39_10020 [Peptococcaceae bacterium]|nr:hypothetical protein [Peptococcaceae bacterium]